MAGSTEDCLKYNSHYVSVMMYLVWDSSVILISLEISHMYQVEIFLPSFFAGHVAISGNRVLSFNNGSCWKQKGQTEHMKVKASPRKHIHTPQPPSPPALMTFHISSHCKCSVCCFYFPEYFTI